MHNKKIALFQEQIETALENFRGDGYFGAVQLREGKWIFCREEEKFNAMNFLFFSPLMLSQFALGKADGSPHH